MEIRIGDSVFDVNELNLVKESAARLYYVESKTQLTTTLKKYDVSSTFLPDFFQISELKFV